MTGMGADQFVGAVRRDEVDSARARRGHVDFACGAQRCIGRLDLRGSEEFGRGEIVPARGDVFEDQLVRLPRMEVYLARGEVEIRQLDPLGLGAAEVDRCGG